jgi:tetratricopeptide (TPR) repeat protein
VIGRGSVAPYKRASPPAARIGQSLGVQYVLEGSLRRAGERVRVNARLIQVRDQANVWAQAYDRDARDVLAVENEIAGAIAGEVVRSLAGERRTSVVVSPEAHEEYLKGRFFWNKRTRDGYERALAHFRRAIDIEPLYARAWSGLADVYLLRCGYGFASPEVDLPKARAAARRAIELDEALAEPHATLGLIAQNYDWDWRTAEREYTRAIELDPAYATAHHWYAEWLTSQGRLDDALAEIERAHELDPLSLMIETDAGKMLYFARRHDDAIQRLRRVLDTDPAFGEAHRWLVWVYASKQMYGEALAELERCPPGDPTFAGVWRAYIAARSGRPGDARRERASVAEICARSACPLWASFLPHVAMGETEQALDALEKMIPVRESSLTSLKVHPIYDPLRTHPRFQRLMELVGLGS